ncbi:hypothetical protein [uncultured Cetobacterium sp.]|uniref:hypothetical protein n=1 Tax=uncultured Cetobacterium sp. TaxID=527638 RepID=UPI002616BFA3|nr:hypothetical protein [uncultured Cetobacterium sp.]
MKNLKKSSKNNGYILPSILFILTLLVWLFSMSLLNYKNEIDSLSSLKISNDDYWITENLSTVAEYEIFKGNNLIESGDYRDIIEYFEDKTLIWIDVNEISKSGYKRDTVKQNEKLIEDRLKFIPFTKNIFEIKLIKVIDIEKNQIEIKIDLFYEYLQGELDFFKSYKREIRGVEARLKNENIGN